MNFPSTLAPFSQIFHHISPGVKKHPKFRNSVNRGWKSPSPVQGVFMFVIIIKGLLIWLHACGFFLYICVISWHSCGWWANAFWTNYAILMIPGYGTSQKWILLSSKITPFVQKLWQISSLATRMPWNDTYIKKTMFCIFSFRLHVWGTHLD